MRYAAFPEVFRVLVNTIKTLPDLFHRWIRFISSLLRTLRLISASLFDTKPCTKIKHLLLALNSDNLKSLLCFFTTLAKVV